MSKIINFLDKRFADVHSAAYLIGGMAIISAVFALVRERSLAYFVGAGETLDIYFAAFRIPDLIFLAATSFISVFAILPFFAEKESESKESLKRFIDATFTVFFIAVVAISAVIFVLLPYLSDLLYSFGPEASGTFITFSRILLLQVIFLSVSTYLVSITQLEHRFVSYAMAPIIYNIGILMGVFGYNQFGPYSLVLGVVAGALLHMLIQVPPVFRDRLIPKIAIVRGCGKDVYRLIKYSLPRSASLSLEALGFVIILGLISTIGAGAITVFAFADNLAKAPLAIIGISYSVASFPTLARYFAKKEYENFKNTLSSVIKNILLLAIPTSIVFFLLRFQVTRVILGTEGRFDIDSLILTSAIFGILTPLVVTNGLISTISRAFFATQRTLAPFLIYATKFVLTIGGSYFLLNLFNSDAQVNNYIASVFNVEGITNNVILAIPLAILLAEIAALLLSLILMFKILELPVRSYINAFVQNLIASFLFGVGVYVMLQILPLSPISVGHVLMQGVMAGMVGLLFWAISLQLFQNTEFLNFKKRVLQSVFKRLK